MRLGAVHYWLTPLMALAGACAPAKRDIPLDAWITDQMGELHIPGLVAAAVDSGRVVWVRAYGLANVGSSEPATDTTPFMIASVSKTITASVIMSLHADGRFKLDDDVNEYLPFPVRNPNHPASPITFRHLLRHRSSIADNGDFYAPFWGEATGDPTTTLGSYLRDYLTPTGASYDREKNFLETAPDERESYCNTCYALIGFLAAEISGLPFERLSDEVLFTPLELTRTAWFLRDFAGTGLAMPYRFVADSGYVRMARTAIPIGRQVNSEPRSRTSLAFSRSMPTEATSTARRSLILTPGPSAEPEEQDAAVLSNRRVFLRSGPLRPGLLG